MALKDLSALQNLSALREEVAVATPDAIALRREIHAHPELAGSERRTAAQIVAALGDLDLEIRTGVGGHGVVAVLHGVRAGPAVGFRADMDAVAGDEQADLEFRSQNNGAAHLCGHDLHAAIAVGMARVLSRHAGTLPGSISFLFQPAEETLQGAAAMIASGVLDEPQLDSIFALHSWPIEVGRVACGPGVGFAGLEVIDITLRGDAATAQSASDLRSAVEALGTVRLPATADEFSWLMNEFKSADGVLEDAVYVSTTQSAVDGGILLQAAVKATREERYADVRQQIGLLAREASAGGATVSPESDLFPPMLNDSVEADRTLRSLADTLGAGNVDRYQASSPFNGEDFALFLQRVPGAMFLLGVADFASGHLGIPHAPDFVADEGAIGVGILAGLGVVLSRLGGV